MTACVQSVKSLWFGSELWRKGDQTQGTIRQANGLQLLVNQEARAITGCFRTTNVGALTMESGLRPVVAQLENRQRRTASSIGQRLEWVTIFTCDSGGGDLPRGCYQLKTGPPPNRPST